LVIDVKGPIASLPQVETYNTLDPLVSAVRIGSYQGRIRLVIDLESKEVPPFSVDQHESVLTAYIGHKKDSDMSATPKAQMSNTRGLLAAQAPPPDAPGADAQAQQQPQTSPTPADTTPESGQSGPAPVAPGQAQAPVYTGTKVSLDFRNADIHDVLRILAEVSGLNIIATDDVKARVTLGLVEVPWDQALDVLLQANGLEAGMGLGVPQTPPGGCGRW
jgi:type IV pilus assembly protein PilQ